MPIFLANFFFFFLQELHTNSPWIALQVCKGMFLMSLLSDSSTFTTACTKGGSPSNFPNLIPRSRAELFLSGTRRWNSLHFCFWETDFLILQRPTDLPDKAPDCSASCSWTWCGSNPQQVVSLPMQWEWLWPLCSAKHFETTDEDQLSAKGQKHRAICHIARVTPL